MREILAIPRDKRTAAQVAEVFHYWRTTVAQWKDANDQIESLWQRYPEGVTQLTLASRAEPRETHMLNRGDWLQADAGRHGGRARVPATRSPKMPRRRG